MYCFCDATKIVALLSLPTFTNLSVDVAIVTSSRVKRKHLFKSAAATGSQIGNCHSQIRSESLICATLFQTVKMGKSMDRDFSLWMTRDF